MKVLFLQLSLVLIASGLIAQSSIVGKVTDAASGEELIGVNLVLTQKGVFVSGTATDFDGNYKISIDPGTYDLECSYVGMSSKKIEGIVVQAGKTTTADIVMEDGGVDLQEVCVISYNVPLIEQSNTASGATITSQDIKQLPTRNISALAATVAGCSVVDQGDQIQIRGSRADATDYYIDGIRVRGHTEPILELEEDLLLNAASPVASDEPAILGHISGGTPAAFSSQADYIQREIVGRELQQSPQTLQYRHDPIAPVFSQESYTRYQENPFKSPVNEEYSTFSIDVDYASYSNVRRYIDYGRTPPPAAVRIEEMVNYFAYDYAGPEDDHPFAVHTEMSACPWNPANQLLHIGLKGKAVSMENAPPTNLVFLIDVSGSMCTTNKLDLLKPAFELLVEQLRAEDKVAIVTYAGNAGLVLPSTSGDQKETILKAIKNLTGGGSTAGAAGINLAYDIAKENFLDDGNNRIILATDGDFNVGISKREDLFQLIREKRESGIYLTTLGFGYGNFKDNTLELLADNGNGQYAYIDNISEARKVFVSEITGTLFTIAKDVKIQLFFDAQMVKNYRLIGYENRLLAKEDFEDDKKDAGELGAGHTVTALYELEMRNKKSNHSILDVRLRYKFPEESQSRFFKTPVYHEPVSPKETTDNFRFSAAVAAFGMLLIDSKYKSDADLQLVTELAESALGDDPYSYREEFLDLVDEYETMTLTSSKE